MKKSRKNYQFDKLTKAQSAFIVNRVVQLGSVEAVGRVYDKKCLVDEFARSVARNFFKGKVGVR